MMDQGTPRPLKKMKRVNAWRVVQRFEVTGATEHGPCSLLIYNNHQPKSTKRKFSVNMGVDFCKAVLRDAISHAEAAPTCVGFSFGGDANISYVHWDTAIRELLEYEEWFNRAIYIRAVGEKAGYIKVSFQTEVD